MSIVKKEEFIERYLEMLKKKLEEVLPEEGFFYEMVEKAEEVKNEREKV